MNLLKLCTLYALRALRLVKVAQDDFDSDDLSTEYFENGLQELDDRIGRVLLDYNTKFLVEESVSAMGDSEGEAANIYSELYSLGERISSIRIMAKEVLGSIRANNVTALQKTLSSINQQISNVLNVLNKAKKFDSSLFVYDDGDLSVSIQQYLLSVAQGLMAYFNWRQDVASEEVEEEEEEEEEKAPESEEGPKGYGNQWAVTKEHTAKKKPIENHSRRIAYRKWYAWMKKVNSDFVNTKRERARNWYQERAGDPEFRKARTVTTKKEKQNLAKSFLAYEQLRTNPALMAENVRKDPGGVERLRKLHQRFIQEKAKVAERDKLRAQKKKDEATARILKQFGITPD